MLTTKLHCTHGDAKHYTNSPAVGPWCPYTSALSCVQRSPQHHTPCQVGPCPRWPFQDLSAPNCLQGNKPVNELLVVWVSHYKVHILDKPFSTVGTAWVVLVRTDCLFTTFTVTSTGSRSGWQLLAHNLITTKYSIQIEIETTDTILIYLHVTSTKYHRNGIRYKGPE